MQILKKYLWLILISILALSLWVDPTYAQIPFNDSFTAKSNCPAVQSLRKGTNSGHIKLIPGKTYPVVGKNQDQASYYLLQVDGANPTQRWVAKQCGQLLSEVAVDGQNGSNNRSVSQEYVLALSWQPAFCETKPAKTECRTQTADRFDATNLTLHGLWPEGRDYCGVSGNLKKIDSDNRWEQLPPITLSSATAQALAEKMPGFSSNLQLHEWYKHGTCYGTSPDRYFQDSMRLQDQVNGSPVRKLFVNNIDNVITTTEIRASFDQSFGAGAGKKVAVECKRDIDEDRVNMVTELQINLAGKINPNTTLANLMASAKNMNKPSCPRGEVDRAGFN
jgi:ribonuclease T2